VRRPYLFTLCLLLGSSVLLTREEMSYPFTHDAGETSITRSQVWDTSSVPEGTYWIYAEIRDSINPPVRDYSDGALTVLHAPDEGPIL
jgi:hypothetical protein